MTISITKAMTNPVLSEPLSGVIDSHAHIDFPVYADDRDDMLTRMRAVGVSDVICIGTTLMHADSPQRMAEYADNIWFTVGVHPNHADEEERYDDGDAMRALASHPRCVAIGEAGLDYFHKKADPQRQRISFETQLAVASDLNLPIVIHSRNADADMIEILDNTSKNLDLALQQPGAQLYFTAKEVPLYRYMDQPGLSAFRYYLWIMENMRRHERFDPLAIPQALIEKGQKLTLMSEAIKCTEFWVSGAFDNLIGQIKFISEASRMSTRVKMQLKEELHAVLDKLFQNIITEQTKEGKPYQMVLCNYLTLSDGALIEIGPNHSEVLFSYGSINYMKSTNPSIVDAFRRGLRYHKLEGHTLGALERKSAEAFIEAIREKVNAL